MDPRTEAFVAEVLAAIDAHAPVLEAYLLGSGAVGGFDPRTSDVDLVVVVEQLPSTERAAMVEQVAAVDRPVRDLELVIYVEGQQPPDYELNLNEGEERPSEEPFWFVLDAAVGQEHAVPMWGQRPWSDFFARIPEERIREAAQALLDWSLRQPADEEFTHRHAARARHYLEHGDWITKKEASQ